MRAALLSLSAAVVLLGASEARAQRPVPTQPHADDDKPHVDAYAAVEYTTVGRQFESFSMRGLSRQPYVLKVADIHLSNFGKFEAGLNAAATSLAALGGFTEPGGPTPADLEQAERYAGLLGYALGKDITLVGEAHFARLVTFAAPQFERSADFPRTTYYYPASGAPVRLHPGSTVVGDTEWYALAVSVRVDGEALKIPFMDSLELGYRYFRLSTLSAYAVGHGSSVADATFLGIVKDSFACHTLAVSSKSTSTDLGEGLQFGGEFHGGIGYSEVSSSLSDSAGGMCFNYGATLSLELRRPSWAFGIGYTGDQIQSLNFNDDHQLSQSVRYTDAYTNRVNVASAGSTWTILGPSQSIYAFGPFARLTVSF